MTTRPTISITLPSLHPAALDRALRNVRDATRSRHEVIVVSPFDTYYEKTLQNSAFYPGVPGLGGQTVANATSASLTGGFADNVLKGVANPFTNVYLPRGAWNVGVKGKGIIFQRRDPVEVVQEVPNSGKSFDEDAIRFRSRSRYVEDWVDASFWYQGSDGSATYTQ